MLFSYDISEDLRSIETEKNVTQILVLCDRNTEQLVRMPYPTLVLPAGEQHKNLHTIEKIWDFLNDQQATRQTLLICIGGGTITDMGGFAAATYKRGIGYVNVPTTLLAMVDASTGGKTGFDHHGLKNEIGCFYPPKETIIHTEFLQTLSPEEFLSGYAEMLKHGLIGSKQEYLRLLRFDVEGYLNSQIKPQADYMQPSEPMLQSDLASLIEASIEIKENITAQDPHEKGLRKSLNFGHTIGHALEAASFIRGENLRHGYAVMQGMVAELYISVVAKGLDREVLRQMTHLMISLYGKVGYACEDKKRLLELMAQDKKNEKAGEINFTLLSAIGQVEVNQVVDNELILEAVEYLFSL